MITFVLPTKNRVEKLKYFFYDTYPKFKNLNPQYIIVDASTDKNYLKNLKNLKKYKKIKFLRQKSTGIQLGCIEAIPHIKTEYVTFLYDDDVMGKNVVDIYKKNIEQPNIFSLGCGLVQPINDKISFSKLDFFTQNKEDILSCYYGDNFKKILKSNAIKSNYILPVSPICTCFKKTFLNKWKKNLFKFTKNNNFRNFIFFKKDVGPDMLIYLMQIESSKKVINFYHPYSVKFSSHNESISIIYGNSFLRIGYWLSRICFFNNKKYFKNQMKSNYYTYLIIIGFILILSNLNNFYYLKNICYEVIRLLKSKNKLSYKYLFSYVYDKVFG